MVSSNQSKFQIVVILFLQMVCISFQHDKEELKRIPGTVYNDLNLKDKELLDQLKKYEIVYPQDVSPIANKFADFYGQDEKIERSISLVHNGKTVVLDLVPNRNLVSNRYTERYYLPDGNTVLRKRTHDCFFHGHARNVENSNLALTTCEGFHGYFRINDETFFIQPLFDKNKKSVAHIIYAANDIIRDEFNCGNHEENETKSDYDFLNQFDVYEHHRTRRDLLTETKYVELILVNTYGQFVSQGSDIAQTKLRAISIANVVDSVYKVHNIRIALVMVETWTNRDLIQVVSNSTTTLANFRSYKNNVLNTKEETKNHDNAHLLTEQRYDQNVIGKAYIGTICTRDASVGINADYSSNSAFTGAIMAHEMGHNFGLQHDDACPLCPSGNCVMNGVIRSTPPEEFSQCSISDLETLLLGNIGHCLFNQPTKLAIPAACGNGFLEDGEECDCGTREDCERIGDTCCNYTSCTLKEGAQCADGACCRDCQLITKGTICRDAVNLCDVPEYCDGASEVCPADLVTVNGLSCNNNKGYCHEGECRTHDEQCTELWVENVFKANDQCYEFNQRDDVHGYCKRTSGTTFMPCAPENVQCGKLWCNSNNATITPKNFGFGYYGTKGTINKTINCWSVLVFQAPGLLERATVLDGTKCGNEMVCQNNECVSLSVAYAGQPTCTNDCNGNGVCNENGNCHCNPGWKCPDCSETYNGPGGSIDSGLNCGAVTTTEATTEATTTEATTEATTTEATTTEATTEATTEGTTTEATTTEATTTEATTTEATTTEATTTEAKTTEATTTETTTTETTTTEATTTEATTEATTTEATTTEATTTEATTTKAPANASATAEALTAKVTTTDHSTTKATTENSANEATTAAARTTTAASPTTKASIIITITAIVGYTFSI